MTEKSLQKILSGALESFSLPSVSASVYSSGDEYHGALGMGNREKDLPAGPDTIYAIASSTKAFTAAVLCSLVAEGMLDLDGRVKSYLPDFRLKDEFAQNNITVRDLLCHRCGLPRHDFSMLTWENFEPSVVTDMLAGLTPAYPLRDCWHYQNHMFVLAGELAARVSGKSYKSLVEERILHPLDMNSSYLFGDEIPGDNPFLSIPYGGVTPDFVPLARDYSAFAAGDGSIYSSSRDMLKWLKFQLHGDEKILPEKFLREMQTPQMLIRKEVGPGEIEIPGISTAAYGLGWFIYTYKGRKLIFHGGSVSGYRSLQMFVPECDIAISVLINGNDTAAREAVGFSILNELLGLPQENFNIYKKIFNSEPVGVCRHRQALFFNPEEYAGHYKNEAYGILHFKAEASNRLVLPIKALSRSLELNPVDTDRFEIYFSEYNVSFAVSFVRNSRGKLVAAEIPFEPCISLPVVFERLD